jgi:hypothetical protein
LWANFGSLTRRKEAPVILKNGREMAGLIGIADLNLPDSASTRSLEYKAYQIAEEMLRWRLISEGLEQLKLRE